VNIRVLVVDDEPLARRNVTVLLQGDPDIGSIAECGSGAEAIEIIRQSRPDLVVLDVQMPECGGFDVLEQLGTDLPRVVPAWSIVSSSRTRIVGSAVDRRLG
jgi:two-component system LytT family response regulator